ncbi:hypothetical protein [Streptomyces sp. DH8]|uniref:hypothetical protein n=1 Tax=Streptomyces sp. DH8 TaxID=2857008 RepID=UPI001E45F76F|nr:hypothetical protein [Streptomyces sp. DH8]
MSRRKKTIDGPPEPAEEAPEETAPGPSRPAGGCVLAALVLGVTAALFAVLDTAAVLALWAAGGAALWRAARSVPCAANPAPPPVSEGVGNTSPQFSVVEDRPGHCTVIWQKEES